MYENEETDNTQTSDMEFADTDYYNIDWSAFYDINQSFLVEDALNDMGFGFFAKRFHDELFDYNSFMLLETQHIIRILNGVPIGIQIKFEKAYKEWKELNSSNISSQISSSSVQTTDTFKITTGCIKEILNSTTVGKDFINSVDKSMPLVNSKRLILIKLINSYCAANKIVLGVEQVKQLSLDIKNMFPQEQSQYYFDHKNGKASGALYAAHNNMLQKLRKNNLMPASSRKRKYEEDISASEEIEKFEYTTEELQSNDFVRRSTANLPLNILIEHWRISAKMRLEVYRKEKSKSITSLYRAMERPDSAFLIDIDFQQLYPLNDSNFKNEWNLNEEKLLEILLKEIKQKNQIQLLKNIKSMTKNQKIAVIISSLHHLLYTPKVIRQNNYRSTILDSLECIIFRADNESTKDLNLKQWQERMEEKKLLLQAYIVSFGKSYESLSDKFCVVVEDIQYIFEGDDSLLDALEILLKIYHVVDLEYPALNRNVYTFLSTKFLKVPSKVKQDMKVNQLIDQL